MRPFSLVSLALAFFVAGCGSSKSVTGGIGTASSSGGSTGGTTGASGGTSTGGATDLSAGSPCTANGQCLSTICGAEGAGHCCVAACAIDDTTCGATDCDSSGACTYPVGQSCRTASCSAGVLTGNACTDAGICLIGTPTVCPGNLTCADATSCRSSCAQDGDCSTGFYCNGGSCAAVLSDGLACTSNSACQSSICGVSGTGKCCTAACDTSDATCGATGCDSTGACTYPSATACGTPSCSGNTLTASTCSGSGACIVGTPTACAGSLNCADATTCLTACTLPTDCLAGLYCYAGSCRATLGDGSACTSNASCHSNVCGVAGTGRCCSTACSTSDPVCGATACDDTGACVYTAPQTPCGTPSCTGSAITDNACSGAGTCVSLGATFCPNSLICASATACLVACATNADCAGSNANFCDTSTGACCPAILTGGTITVDNGSGSDATACCGYDGDAGPCQTLTETMRLIDGTNSLSPGTAVTVNAAVDGGGGDWKNGEVYPIALGWGVTLVAPGVYFTDTNGKAEIFDVALHAGEDAGNAVTIEGGLDDNFQAVSLVVGSDTLANVTTDTTSILVEANAILDLGLASVFEGIGNTGIDVQAGGTLNILGIYQYGIGLGGDLPNGSPFNTTFGTGILCNGTVSDVNAFVVHSLGASSQNLSIDAEDNCVLTLIWDPLFGTGLNGGGGYTNAGTGCASGNAKPDGTAILVNGANANVTLGGPRILCMSQYGIEVTNSTNSPNPPVVTIQTGFGYPHIYNCSFAGIYASAGTVYVSNTEIYDNFIGVEMENDSNGNHPTVYLNDNSGTAPINDNGQGPTLVYCNSNQETGGHAPGIDVYNNSAGALSGDWAVWSYWFQPNGDGNALWWPDTFYCDNAFDCICVSVDSSGSAQCMNTGYSGDAGVTPDGMNLVLGTGTGPTPSGSYTLGTQASTDGWASGYCQ